MRPSQLIAARDAIDHLRSISQEGSDSRFIADELGRWVAEAEDAASERRKILETVRVMLAVSKCNWCASVGKPTHTGKFGDLSHEVVSAFGGLAVCSAQGIWKLDLEKLP